MRSHTHYYKLGFEKGRKIQKRFFPSDMTLVGASYYHKEDWSTLECDQFTSGFKAGAKSMRKEMEK